MTDVEVIVVGGGVAGGAVACAFGARGVSVVLVDRKRTESTVSRGEVLHRGAQALLEQWGVLNDFQRAIGAHLESYRLHHHLIGTVAEFDHGGDIVVPHPVIEELLVNFAEDRYGATVLRGATARALVEVVGRTAGVRTAAEDGETEVRAPLIVGADGSHSFVRQALGIGCPAQGYAHELCYCEAARLPGMTGNEIYLSRRGFIMRRPITSDRMRVSFATPSGKGRAYLRLSEEDLGQELARRWPVLRGSTIDREGRHVYTLTRQHADAYWRPGAVIIGDAAHVNHPATGTGMHMAMEDAEELAETVANVLREPEELDAALGRYEAARRPKVQANIDRTHQVATFVVQPGRRASLRRLRVLLAYRITPRSRRLPLLALPRFTVGCIARLALRSKRQEGMGVYRNA